MRCLKICVNIFEEVVSVMEKPDQDFSILGKWEKVHEDLRKNFSQMGKDYGKIFSAWVFLGKIQAALHNLSHHRPTIVG